MHGAFGVGALTSPLSLGLSIAANRGGSQMAQLAPAYWPVAAFALAVGAVVATLRSPDPLDVVDRYRCVAVPAHVVVSGNCHKE